MKFLAHGHSDVGFLRETNEDSFLVRPNKGVFAVADGVGGLPHGALASLLAVQNFDALVREETQCKGTEDFRTLVHLIHSNIIECGRIVGGQHGIGTTFSGVRFLKDGFLFAHVGDSSILIFNRREGDLSQVSSTHTLAAELIAKHGEEAAADMPEHYHHTLTRCLGQDIDFEVEVGHHAVETGDKIILCSDGLTNMVGYDEISSMCAKSDPKYLVDELIDLANQNGGIDNTTVVCVQVE